MNFDLTPEQKLLRLEIREFAEKEILPHWLRLRKKKFPWDIFKKMAERGLAGAIIPEEYGGAGLDLVSFAIATEELCRADGGVGLSIGASQSLVGEPILRFGTEEQKKTWLPQIASGKMIAAYAQTEPQAGSDVGSISTKAVCEKDELILNGQKQFITNGSIAGLILALVRTENIPEHPRRGLTTVLIDAKKARVEKTLKILRDENKTGLHSSPTTAFILENCRIPVASILGTPGMGFPIAMATLTASRAMIAAQSLGLAQAAFDCTLEYVLERQQFGKKIAEFQITQSKLARMALKIESARLLAYRAAWLVDTKGFLNFQDYMSETAMAKLYASEIAEEVAAIAERLHGGMGFMKEMRISAIRDDARVLQTYEGTSDIQELIIARKFLRPRGIKI